ncbi:MAG: NADPH:quinone reductase [Acidimicrobiales bacterium]
MRAAWYDRQGDAADVLTVGDVDRPEPGAGEVRVRITYSGINAGDVKKRRGWLGSAMPYPRVIPHSDGAGVINAAGPGADPARIGRRVWVYGAQSYRPFGTAAAATVVPEALAVELPPNVNNHVGAALGIPGITAHRAVFADGPVRGTFVLVHGVRGAVGSLAAQLARWGGALVIGTVRSGTGGVPLDGPDPAADILRLAPGGVDRVIDVAFGANIELNAAVATPGCVIAAYASAEERPPIPYWPLAFSNVTIRLLGSDDFPAEAKQAAARDLTRAAAEGALHIEVAEPYPLDRIADAHRAVEAGSRHGRVLLKVPG